MPSSRNERRHEKKDGRKKCWFIWFPVTPAALFSLLYQFGYQTNQTNVMCEGSDQRQISSSVFNSFRINWPLSKGEPEHLKFLTNEDTKDGVIPPETSVCSNKDESKKHFNNLGYTSKLVSDLHSLPGNNYVFYLSDISLLGQPSPPTSSLQETDFSLDTTVTDEKVENDDDYDNCESTCDSIETASCQRTSCNY